MSIDFKSTKGIFQQIADNLCHQILEGKLLPGERVPSVRELALEFEVNRNTLLRTYSILQDAGIIENKRGIGLFVTTEAIEKIRVNEKKVFFETELPEFLKKIQLLGITETELADLFRIIKNNENL